MNRTESPNLFSTHTILKVLAWILGATALVMVLLVAMLLFQSPVGSTLTSFTSWLFAMDSVQAMWFITRAAGLTSYLLIWLSVAWGLAVSTKILDTVLHRTFTYDFHQFISLLAVAFIFLHITVLLFDRYLPYSLTQVLVPFLSPYRPVWVGIGVIAFYLTILVTITFYMRSIISMKTFRAIHVFSLLAYLGATLHGFLSGTDSSLPAVQVMYAGSFLSVVFLSAYWLIAMKGKPRKAKVAIPVERSSQLFIKR